MTDTPPFDWQAMMHCAGYVTLPLWECEGVMWSCMILQYWRHAQVTWPPESGLIQSVNKWLSLWQPTQCSLHSISSLVG